MSDGPNTFALVIFGAWDDRDFPTEDVIRGVYKSKNRKEPVFLDFGPGYEDQLKNWLCKPQSRESDLIAINGIGGIKSMFCHGIETDIVFLIGSACKKGCFSMINPVVMTRAKSRLIVSKFQPTECVLCFSKLDVRTLQKHGIGYNNSFFLNCDLDSARQF